MSESKISRNIHLPTNPSILAAMLHGVKSLSSRGTAAGEHLWQQGRAARRQDPAAVRHGGRPLPLCHLTVRPF
jgi:hypothetical protein